MWLDGSLFSPQEAHRELSVKEGYRHSDDIQGGKGEGRMNSCTFTPPEEGTSQSLRGDPSIMTCKSPIPVRHPGSEDLTLARHWPRSWRSGCAHSETEACRSHIHTHTRIHTHTHTYFQAVIGRGFRHIVR